MEERAEKEWKARFKAMKKALGWSHDDIAQFIGAEMAILSNLLLPVKSRLLPNSLSAFLKKAEKGTFEERTQK
ncbi:MAG: hypothetical protein H7246_16075 [Phycisphaerae bacterium]|nr:hypothetical protein [Saprospiraceae bacterium]